MGTAEERAVLQGEGMPRRHGSGASEREDLEELIDAALAVPGGLELGRLLYTDQHEERVSRRLQSAEPPAPSPAPRKRPPRVVVEIPGPALGAAMADLLRGEGYEVTVCGGPASFPSGRCPLVEGRGCPLAQEADVVVHALGLNDPEGRAVWEAHDWLNSATPTVLVTSLSRVPRPGYLLEGQEVIEGRLTPERLVASIQGVLQTRTS